MTADPFQKKIRDLLQLVGVMGKAKVPPDLRLLILTESGLIKIKHGRYQEVFARSQNWLDYLTQRRGDILDVFARLETFVDEIIVLRIAREDNKRADLLYAVLQNVDLFSRLGILTDWGIIDNINSGRFQELKKVRNGLAHQWDLEDIMFKGKRLTENFDAFKQSLQHAWNYLLEKYKEEQKIIDIDAVIKRINEYNQSKS